MLLDTSSIRTNLATSQETQPSTQRAPTTLINNPTEAINNESVSTISHGSSTSETATSSYANTSISPFNSQTESSPLTELLNNRDGHSVTNDTYAAAGDEHDLANPTSYKEQTTLFTDITTTQLFVSSVTVGHPWYKQTVPIAVITSTGAVVIIVCVCLIIVYVRRNRGR